MPLLGSDSCSRIRHGATAAALVLAVASGLGAEGLAAQTLVFEPVADAPVKLYAASSTHATSDLSVRWYPHSARNKFSRSFLRFQVTGLSGVTVDALVLELTEGGGGSAGDVAFEVRELNGGSWSESGITWDNQPTTLGKTIGAWNGGQLAEDQTITVALNPALLRDGDGTYELVLIEMGDGGMQECFFDSREDGDPPRLIVNGSGAAPHAGLYTRVTEGGVPWTVAFEGFASAGARATSYAWDFGDGGSSTLATPTHTYTTPGRYDVSLTTSGPDGTAAMTRAGYVLAYPADGAAGTLFKYGKISDLSGGQGPALDDQDMFGRACAAIGDLDGNGVVDLVVGAVGDDDSQSGNEDMPGAVWILFLRANGTVLSSAKISDTSGGLSYDLDANDGFGRVVAAIGDLDQDGVPDIAVGANYDDDSASNAGAVYVLFLNADGSVRADQKISALSGWPGAPLGGGDQFGRGIACVGDLDGNGVQDLAVGATGDNDGGGDVGAVYVLFMSSDGTVESHAKISNTSGGMTSYMDTSSSLWFGMCVASLGDVDGDGVCDLAVGAMLDDAIYHAAGSFYVLLLNPDGTVKQDHYVGALSGHFDGELEEGDEFGGAIAGPGDLDADGIPDVVVGSIRDDDNPFGDTQIAADRGAVYVFFLNADGSVKGYQKISDTRGGFDAVFTDSDRVGESLGAIGDFDGDGRNDLLIGSRFDDDGGLNRGAVYIALLDDGGLGAAQADFSAQPTAGDAPLSVVFTDLSSGSPATSWLWDFGDGGSSTQVSPTHVYAVDGTYDVTLAITDAGGSGDVETKPGFVVVGSIPGVVRYGCGVNPVGSTSVEAGAPVLGTSVVFGVDNLLGTQPAGSSGFVLVALAPDPAHPCGSPMMGFGMGGGVGELLISLAPPNPIRSLVGTPFGGPGNPSLATLVIPNNPSLAGLKLYTQGYLLDPAVTNGVRIGLADALELTLR